MSGKDRPRPTLLQASPPDERPRTSARTAQAAEDHGILTLQRKPYKTTRRSGRPQPPSSCKLAPSGLRLERARRRTSGNSDPNGVHRDRSLRPLAARLAGPFRPNACATSEGGRPFSRLAPHRVAPPFRDVPGRPDSRWAQRAGDPTNGTARGAPCRGTPPANRAGPQKTSSPSIGAKATPAGMRRGYRLRS